MQPSARLFFPIASLSSLLAWGCSSEGPGPSSDSGTGGAEMNTGGGVASGGVASGGNASGGSASGGTGVGGGSGGTLGPSTGGSSSGGASSGGTSSSGGSATGGAEATGGSGGDDSGAPQPSAGCGSPAPQLGSAASPLTISGHQYYVKLPASYDESTPHRVLFMFNPTGNPINWAEDNAGYEKNGAKDAAIRVYPHPANSSNGWGASDVAFFEPLYDEIMGSFCADEARVFAAGESSGGDFSSILGCEHGDKFRAIAPCATKPVGGYALDANSRQCTGQVASIVIHGKNDNVVGPENGPLTRDFYSALNNCSAMSEPVEGYTDNLSNCVMFTGCDDGFPVYWCQHEDPEYGNTNHGWPRFAANMTWEIFEAF